MRFDLELVLTLAMIWVPVSLLATIALCASWHVTHREDQ